MTIQDLSYIQTIIETNSISKAAARLYVSQPSLSKCIKKVEQEYSITIFERSRGTSLKLTEQGECFLEMARAVLQAHRLFEGRLTQLRSENLKTIVFASPIQRAYTISGPLMRWIYDHYPDYSMELKTIPSKDIEAAVRTGVADLAIHLRKVNAETIYSREVFRSENYLYLRPGCPAAANAVPREGGGYPVLSMEYLAGEPFVGNLPQTTSRQAMDQAALKAGVILAIREEPTYSLRIAMVNAGYACTMVSDDAVSTDPTIDPSRLFSFPENERIVGCGSVICRRGFQNDIRFKIICEALEAIYKKP